MISKIATFTDPNLDKQIHEIVSQQFDKKKTVTVTFTAANTTTQVDAGANYDRYIVIDRNANISVWRVTSDSKFVNLQASGAGTATIMFWKGET